jgi:O-acetyl-ADP-ribose deacetylase (regulator of RNase III)
MVAEILSECSIGGCLLQAVRGDLTVERVDAIVNAANSRLIHGGGLAGAIVKHGGPEIQEASDLVAPIAVGAAVVTTAGALPARWIIHAVGPVWGDGNEEKLLRSAVCSSLECARDLGAASISLPAISTGIFGYPKPEGTRVIVEEVRRWLAAHPASSIVKVRLTAFDILTANLFSAALAATND